MFWGERRPGGYYGTGTLLRGAILSLLGVLAVLNEAGPARAVSSGCISVRGGALNTTGVDVNFNGNFDTGETVVWTFVPGGPAQEITVTPPGAPFLPVVNNVATFTFPTTNPFLIEQTGGSALTANCNETTAEKQAAVKAAIKTLTSIQLTQSLAFQGQILQELTSLFVSGAVPIMLLKQLEPRLAALKPRLTQVNNSIRRIESSLPGHKARLARLRGAVRPGSADRVKKARQKLESIRNQLGERRGLGANIRRHRGLLARARRESATSKERARYWKSG